MTATQTIQTIQSTAERVKNNAPVRFPEAASPGDSHRQGDIYITLLDALPNGAQPVPNPVAQLAPGNTQGSRHTLDSLDGVTVYVRKSPSALDGPILMLASDRVVTHPEHGHVVLPADRCYAITYQRDLDAEERERRVLD